MVVLDKGFRDKAFNLRLVSCAPLTTPPV